MVTKEHEAPIDLLRRFPELVPTVMRQLNVDIDIPEAVTVEFASERCTENKPAELTADEVPLLKAGDVVKAAVVFEVQRKDVETKFAVWPRYVASVWSRHQVPTVLLVYCELNSEARKAAQPIHLGPGNVITPVVVSPATLPPILDVEQYADRVDLAVFAALLHSGGPQAGRTLENLCALLDTIGEEQAKQYAGCLIEILPELPRTYLEDLMTAGTYEYQTAFSRMEARGLEKGLEKGLEQGLEKGLEQGLEKGRAQGEARMLLRMLEMRGFEVTAEVRDRVLQCTSVAQLEIWADRIPLADSLEKVFE